MILPTTYMAALLLSIASMILWGSWANTQKLAGKWRFELFYYDYSFGVVLCALIAAFTLGSWLPQELTFTDNFLIAAKRQMAYGVAAGMVFNLANMLLVAAISVAGMAVAFPVTIGLALIIGVVLNYSMNPQGNAALLFGGAGMVLLAIVVDAFAYNSYLELKFLEAQNVALQADPRAPKKRTRKAGAGRGIALSIVGGILMGLFYPLVEAGKAGDSGVGPYGIALLFAGGVLFSSIIYIPFFLNFPVAGEPLELKAYFKGTRNQHLLGIAGGLVWMAGAITNFLAASAPVSVQVGPAVSYGIGQGATLISALWGLLVWREFKGANLRVKGLLAGMLILFIVGLSMIAIAPLHSGK
jgi:glucose uptake protein